MVRRRRPRPPFLQAPVLVAWEPSPEFLASYDRVVVQFSGTAASLAALLRIYEQEVPPEKIHVFSRVTPDATCLDVPMTPAVVRMIATLLDVGLTFTDRDVHYHITADRTYETGHTLVVSGDRRWKQHQYYRPHNYLPPRKRVKRRNTKMDPPRPRVVHNTPPAQFEPHSSDHRELKYRGRRKRYVDHYQPILHNSDQDIEDIINRSEILVYALGRVKQMLDIANFEERTLDFETLALAALSMSMPGLSDKAHQFAKSAKARGTYKEYERTLNRFVNWCKDRGEDARYADATLVANYFADKAAGGSMSASSQIVAAAAIKAAYALADIPIDWKANGLQSVIRGIQRMDADRVKRQATAATPDDVRQLLQACPGDTALGIRNRAIIMLMYAGALRQSEVIALRISDIIVDPRGRGFCMRIRRSKGDQLGVGIEKVIVFNRDDPEFCPATLLDRWMRLRKVGRTSDEDFLFVQIQPRWGNVLNKRLTQPNEISKMISEAAEAAGLLGRFSSHCLRRGALTEASRRGAKIGELQALAGHRHPATTMRYIEAEEAWQNPVSAKILGATTQGGVSDV